MIIEMSTDHMLILLDVATRVAERVCTDPLVAALLEPAVCIAADDEGCNATFVERLEVIGLMNEFHVLLVYSLDRGRRDLMADDNLDELGEQVRGLLEQLADWVRNCRFLGGDLLHLPGLVHGELFRLHSQRRV